MRGEFFWRGGGTKFCPVEDPIFGDYTRDLMGVGFGDDGLG